MPNPLKAKGCPLCGEPTSPDHTPFCSRGCKDRDLLKWLGEGYRIPGTPITENELDGEGLDSDGGDR